MIPSVSPRKLSHFVRDTGTGLVDCGNWAVSARWAVPSTAVSGFTLPGRFGRITAEPAISSSSVRNDAGIRYAFPDFGHHLARL